MVDKTNRLITSLLIIFLCSLVVVLYHYRKEIHIPEFILNPNRSSGQNVSCAFVTTVGSKSLSIGFAIPAGDRRHKERLMQMIPKIQHELLLTANERDLITLYEQRDFDTLKTHLLTVVNSQVSPPVKNLYFESFDYN